MNSIPETMINAIAQAKALPEQLTVDDFEVVEWDGSPVNGAAALALRAQWLDADGEPCPDARAVLIRERASRIVFCCQYMHPTAGRALRSDADVEQTAAYLRAEVLPRMPMADAAGPVTACLRNAASAAGLSPQQMAAMLGRLGG